MILKIESFNKKEVIEFLKIFMIIIFLNFNALSQLSPEEYYKEYFNLQNTNIDNEKKLIFIDSISKKLFSTNKCTFSQVGNIYNKIKYSSEIDHKFYIKKLLEVSKSYYVVKHEFVKNNHYIKNKDLKKIKKETIYHSKNCLTFTLMNMLLKDQFYRKFHKKNIHKIDSINSIYVKKLLNDSSMLNLNYFSEQFLNLILLHGGYKFYRNEIQLIHQFIIERKLENYGLIELIERASIYEGVTFQIIENKLISTENSSVKLCNNMYTTCLGTWAFNIRGNMVYVPLNPNFSIKQIDQLRNYVCIDKLIFEVNNKNRYSSVIEWCEKIK